MAGGSKLVGTGIYLFRGKDENFGLRFSENFFANTYFPLRKNMVTKMQIFVLGTFKFLRNCSENNNF